MEIVKVWKVGNSNVVTLPRSLAEGWEPGTEVILDRLPTGEIVMRKAESLKEHIRAAGRRAIEENQEALRILEAHDRGEA